MSDPADIVATLFTGLADPIRVRLLREIADGEVTVGELARRLEEPQPKVSAHLARLRNCGLVETRREHRLVHYRAADDRVARLLEIATGLLDDQGRLVEPAAPAVTVNLASRDEPPPATPPAAAARAGLHLVFRLGGERYALPAWQVREVVAYREPRRVASSSSSLVGMLDLRGSLVAVFDLAAALGVGSGQAASIVIAVDRWGRAAGLTVTSVEQLIDVAAGDLRPAGSTAAGVAGLAIGADGIVVVIDADALVGTLVAR